jgi:hypothetical protein
MDETKPAPPGIKLREAGTTTRRKCIMGGVYGSEGIYGYPGCLDLFSDVIQTAVTRREKVAKLSMDVFGDSRSNGEDLNTTQASQQTRFQAVNVSHLPGGYFF